MKPLSLRILAGSALLLALLVVLLGGWTRLSDAGLSCPDWPGCYGEMLIPSSAEARMHIQQRYPDSPLDVRRGWLEMTHRYLAGTLGLLLLILGWQGWQRRARADFPWRLCLGLSGLVIAQGLFGMWTVTLGLLPQIVTLHLLGGLLTLALLLRLNQRLADWAKKRVPTPSSLRPWLGGALLLLFLQLALGGWTSANYAGWSCNHWWRCAPGNSWQPDFDTAFSLPQAGNRSYLGGHLDHDARATIQMTHRLAGLLLSGYLILVALLVARRCRAYVAAASLAGLLVLQLGLGMTMVVSGLPPALAMGHHAGAVMLLLALVGLYGRLGFYTHHSSHLHHSNHSHTEEHGYG